MFVRGVGARHEGGMGGWKAGGARRSVSGASSETGGDGVQIKMEVGPGVWRMEIVY